MIAGPSLDLRTGQYSQSLEHGVATLRCFTSERPVLGIADVADELGCSRSTTYRYMSTLRVFGYLELVVPSHKYRLAPHASDVGRTALALHPLHAGARAWLEWLHEHTGYTASLGVLVGRELFYLERVRGYGPRQREIDLGVLGLRRGYRLPAHCTAMGKLLLAPLPKASQRMLFAGLELKQYGPCSITRLTHLTMEFDRILADGYAISDRELGPILAAAVGIPDGNGEITASVCVELHATKRGAQSLFGEIAPQLTLAGRRLATNLPEGYCGGRG